MCVLIFSINLSETLLILRRFQRAAISNVHWSSCKLPVILVRLQWKLNFLTDFLKILKFHSKSNQWVPSFSVQMDMTNISVAFHNFLTHLEMNKSFWGFENWCSSPIWKLVFVTYLKTGVRHLFENWCSSPIWKLVFVTYLKTGVRHLFENWCSSPIWKLVFVTYLKIIQESAWRWETTNMVSDKWCLPYINSLTHSLSR